ncbi:MAG: hypothetical protein ONB46_01300 [candidate division KSB1 bacterium]|nr:hypothetical protein [candidate division KSB1 bacterium]MDZ7364523.1 hypothetical protein [candidate division KSB1 bacterium]MDZ7405774.1 hypothetical protein [candidate division KSB1 bacterium]
MKLNAPNQTLWLVAVVLGVIGILGKLSIIPAAIIAGNAFWLVTAGFAILALTSLFKGV